MELAAAAKFLLIFCISGSHLCYGASPFVTNEIWYWSSNEKTTFEKASQSCERMRSRLAVLPSDDIFISVTRKCCSKDEQYWIGLRLKESVFYWGDITNHISSSNWVPNEPNKSGECVRLVRFYRNKYYPRHLLADNRCSNSYHYVCEKQYSSDGYNFAHGSLKVHMEDMCQCENFPSSGRIPCLLSCLLRFACVSFGYNQTHATCTLYQRKLSCGHGDHQTTPFVLLVDGSGSGSGSGIRQNT